MKRLQNSWQLKASAVLLLEMSLPCCKRETVNIIYYYAQETNKIFDFYFPFYFGMRVTNSIHKHGEQKNVLLKEFLFFFI